MVGVMREPKYMPGEPFVDIGLLIAWLYLPRDHGWCYWAGRPKHPTVIKNMTLYALEVAVRAGTIRPALTRRVEAAPALTDDKEIF